MMDFDYQAPTSIAEAVSLLDSAKGAARCLAGGTDLIVQLREQQRQASLVVDLKRIPELKRVTLDPADGLVLGAAVPCYEIYQNREISKGFAALVDAARLIGGWQIQCRASIGGNLCNASPAADSIPALIALGATCRIAGATGERTVPVAELCTGPGATALGPGEVLVALEIPPLAGQQRVVLPAFHSA